MKTWFICIFTALVLLFSITPAQALVLIDEPFSDTSEVVLNANSGIKTTDDYNMWIDFPDSVNHWGISETGGNYYAEHTVTYLDETNILMYGIDATGLVPGTELTFSFDYMATRKAYAYIVGMDIDYHYLDNNAGWLDGETKTDGWETNRRGTDGVVLAKYELTTLDLTTWTPFVSSPLIWTGSGVGYDLTDWTTPVTYYFDTLAIAFTMGDSYLAAGFRAVDNIKLEAAIPTPEPTTMLLLGLGLIGLAGFRRKA